MLLVAKEGAIFLIVAKLEGNATESGGGVIDGREEAAGVGRRRWKVHGTIPLWPHHHLRVFGRLCLDATAAAAAALLVDETVVEGREGLAQTTQLVLETLDLVGLESRRWDAIGTLALCVALVAVAVAHERDHHVALIETGTCGACARIVFVLITVRDGRCDDNDVAFFLDGMIELDGRLSVAFDLLVLVLSLVCELLVVGALCRLGALLLAPLCGSFGDPLATRVAAIVVVVFVALKLVVSVALKLVVVELVPCETLARPSLSLQTALTTLATRVLLGPDGLWRASGARGRRQTQLGLVCLVVCVSNVRPTRERGRCREGAEKEEDARG